MATEGQQLDNLGEIVGETRQGRNDDDYLIALRAKIKLNGSSGTLEEVLTIIALVAAALTIEVREFFPAAFSANVTTEIVLESEIDRVVAFVRASRPAGILGQVEYHTAGAFQYDGPAGSGYDLGKYGNAKVS